MKVAVLIVAAGRGHRAGTDLPKQYMPICGKAILRHTVEAFQTAASVSIIKCVIHPDDQDLYGQSMKDISLTEPAIGGNTRQKSVMSGLESLASHDPSIVLIHDAARPFITPEHIELIISETVDHGAIIPALPMTDTVKQTNSGYIEHTLKRDTLVRAQTPQAFRFKMIYMAHRKMADNKPELTDDSAIAEACNIKVKTIAGIEENFKITTVRDLKKAEQIMTERYTDIRTGIGYDVHAFEEGNQVILGGVSIAHDRKLKGHSDADVALHALTDALLGAIGDGDIGSHFPPSDPKWKGASSDIFLVHAAKLIQKKNGLISNIDLNIICEAPKIGPHRTTIRENIAQIVNIAPSRISIKATTTEKLGFTGRQEGIAVQAIATIRLPE